MITLWESEAQLWFTIATLPFLIILLSFAMFCWVISVNLNAHFLKPGTSHFSCLQNLKYSYSSEVIKYLILKNLRAWMRHFCPFPVHWKTYAPQIQLHLLRNHLLDGHSKCLYVKQLSDYESSRFSKCGIVTFLTSTQTQ